MKVFKSKTKNTAYLLYRLVNPLFDPVKFAKGVKGYFDYFADLRKYKDAQPDVEIMFSNLYPMLDDKVDITPFDAHYFHQQLWVFEDVLKKKPHAHTDVGSTYQMSGYLSRIVKTTFIDIRPIETHLDNLDIMKGSVLEMPYEDDSVESLSCLHVLEHIGLGRYGDDVDPRGMEKGCAELSRVLSPGGTLYVSVPFGRDRICFNAHRVSSYETIVSYFGDLALEEFSIVDDEGSLHRNANYKDFKDMNYSCGMFRFTKTL